MSREPRSSIGLFVQLSVMMFVLFFVWGAWYVTMGTFMAGRKFDAEAISWAYSVAPIAAIVTPFFMGVFADRFVNAEKLQGALLLLSGFFIALAPQFAEPETQWVFVALLLAHTLCFMPNLGLSNTICLKHLVDSERDYPIVRVFATLGWIVAGWIVSFLFMAEESPVQFYTAAAAAWGVGIYSFFLPRTPPPGKGVPLKMGELYGSGTWRYFKKRAFAIFMVASLLASMGMMPYWGMGSTFVNFLGIERSGAFFTMGQMAELVVLAVILPVFIKRFGIKWTMGIGLLCWALRFVLFSEAATSSGGSMMALLVIAVLLHGFSYDFVFVSGYLYVDKHVGEEVRAQAQGLLVVFTQGVGFFLSSQLFVGYLGSRYGVPGNDAGSWQSYWLVPAIFMAVVLVLFWFAFREERRTG